MEKHASNNINKTGDFIVDIGTDSRATTIGNNLLNCGMSCNSYEYGVLSLVDSSPAPPSMIDQKNEAAVLRAANIEIEKIITAPCKSIPLVL